MSIHIIEKGQRGTIVGNTAKKLLGFFGAAPVLRPSGSSQAALTDSSGGTAGTALSTHIAEQFFTVPLTSLATGIGTGAMDILTGFVPGFRFQLLGLEFVTTIAGTGVSASQVFNLEIGTTNTTGGVLTLDLASQATVGVVTSATAITAANVGAATDAISLEKAGSGTVFTAGAGYFVIKLKNLDTADAIASLAAQGNAIRSALTTLGLIKGS
jgi:hypothetical protein